MPPHAKGQQACQRSWRGDPVCTDAYGYHWHLGLPRSSWANRVWVAAAVCPVHEFKMHLLRAYVFGPCAGCEGETTHFPAHGSWQLNSKSLLYYFILFHFTLCVWMSHLSVYLCTTFIPEPLRYQRRALDPLELRV
uniref:Uncharacterized protein n=1 Tax=Mus musculus TaxID=10090 RepID=Q3TZS6_MOUSE|nr:unnamed protein product [Mus musculus]